MGEVGRPSEVEENFVFKTQLFMSGISHEIWPSSILPTLNLTLTELMMVSTVVKHAYL